MIQDPLAILAFLAAIVAIVFQVAALPAARGVFDRLPALVWAYAVPMFSTTLGLLPAESPLYSSLARYLLPASLVLLLLSSEIKAIARLGRSAVMALAAGAFGIALGSIVAFFLLRPLLPADAWKSAGALTATWIGGSANLLAVAATLDLDPGTVIIVDTVVGYSWMGLLIFLATKQEAFDRWTGADRGTVAAASARLSSFKALGARPVKVADATLMVGLALGVTALALRLGEMLPQVGEVLKPFSWAIIIVTTVSLLLSLTPLSRLEAAGASTLGYAAFYLLIASVGAQGDLRRLAAQPIMALFGVVVLAVHALVLLAAIRLLRAPLFFFGAASQACTGGVSSAPIVADIFQPGTAPVGLLLAVVGGVLGTYAGLLVAQFLSSQ
ncbi:MAG TPA: DUF819 family protein [Vicinamibacteria bacterium]